MLPMTTQTRERAQHAVVVTLDLETGLWVILFLTRDGRSFAREVLGLSLQPLVAQRGGIA